MFQGNSIDEGSPPEDLSDHQIELVPGVVFDNPPFGHQFGDCKLQPPSAVAPGDTVTVKFVSGTTTSTKNLLKPLVKFFLKQPMR